MFPILRYRTLGAGGKRSLSGFPLGSSSLADKISLKWLDLRGTHLSFLERLVLEEFLLHHDPEQANWFVTGWHEGPLDKSKHLWIKPPSYILRVNPATRNSTAVVVLGHDENISPCTSVDVSAVEEDGVWALQSFAQGTADVQNVDSIHTTFIGRPQLISQSSSSEHKTVDTQSVMEWTGRHVYKPFLERLQQEYGEPRHLEEDENWSTMVPETKSCCGLGLVGPAMKIPKQKKVECEIDPAHLSSPKQWEFSANGMDYAWGGQRIAGNVQAIAPTGWVNHTGWIWDASRDERTEYLLSHRNGASVQTSIALQNAYPDLKKKDWVERLQTSCQDMFSIEQVSVDTALEAVESSHGSLQHFWKTQSKTRLLSSLK